MQTACAIFPVLKTRRFATIYIRGCFTMGRPFTLSTFCAIEENGHVGRMLSMSAFPAKAIRDCTLQGGSVDINMGIIFA